MYIGRNSHRISFAYIKQGIAHKAAIALNRALFVHSTHAPTLHACAVVELRFVTERKKKKKTRPNLYLGRFLRKARVKNL